MIGAKSGIDIYNYSTFKNFNKITCPALGDIIKLKVDINNNYIGGSDSQGNFAAYKFNNTYQSHCIFSLKKSNISDFSFMNSNIIATCSQKDSLIQVFDPLIHPNRNVIFKDSISYINHLEYSYNKNKLLATRRG